MASSFIDRIIRAARLDRAVYEEVEADTTATAQALGVVVLTSVAAGIGVGAGAGGVVAGLVAGIVAWAVWAGLVYLIGGRLFPEPQTRADWGELARTLGFAAGPGVLRVLGVVPVLGELVFFVTGIWVLVTTVVAVQQALDYRSLPRTIAVCALGWIAQLVVFTLLVRVARFSPML